MTDLFRQGPDQRTRITLAPDEADFPLQTPRPCGTGPVVRQAAGGLELDPRCAPTVAAQLGLHGLLELGVGHRLMPQVPNPLRAPDEKIGDRTHKMNQENDQGPNDLGVSGRRLVPQATDESAHPENRPEQNQGENEHPFRPMRQTNREEWHAPFYKTGKQPRTIFRLQTRLPIG